MFFLLPRISLVQCIFSNHILPAVDIIDEEKIMKMVKCRYYGKSEFRFRSEGLFMSRLDSRHFHSYCGKYHWCSKYGSYSVRSEYFKWRRLYD